jgi:hypothetical protein
MLSRSVVGITLPSTFSGKTSCWMLPLRFECLLIRGSSILSLSFTRSTGTTELMVFFRLAVLLKSSYVILSGKFRSTPGVSLKVVLSKPSTLVLVFKET